MNLLLNIRAKYCFLRANGIYYNCQQKGVDRIPFEVRLEQPNKETVAAMLEAERIAKDPSVKGYNDLDELFADLKR